MNLMSSLTRREWIRVGFALALVAMAAFCVFEAYLLAYLNTSALGSVARTPGEFQNRADLYAWAGSLLEVAAALVLVPLFPFCLLYTSPSPRDLSTSRMPSSA